MTLSLFKIECFFVIFYITDGGRFRTANYPKWFVHVPRVVVRCRRNVHFSRWGLKRQIEMYSCNPSLHRPAIRRVPLSNVGGWMTAGPPRVSTKPGYGLRLPWCIEGRWWIGRQLHGPFYRFIFPSQLEVLKFFFRLLNFIHVEKRHQSCLCTFLSLSAHSGLVSFFGRWSVNLNNAWSTHLQRRHERPPQDKRRRYTFTMTRLAFECKLY